MKLQAIRGMNDIGAPEIHMWQHIEGIARRLYQATGFHEVRTPLVEPTALFKRGVGETTDIVEKEMYTFEDRNGDSLTLRPEGTASIVRAGLEHSWIQQNPVLKIYYFGPMFRHERPQKGRYRQHFQFGLEIFGVEGPRADAEIMATQHLLFKTLGVTEYELKVSSIGCTTCRPVYREKLLRALGSRRTELCGDCRRRIDKNPLRVFDCKVETCKKIAATLPVMLDNLCEPCAAHFSGVKDGLTKMGVPYTVDPKVVRGIDYYTRTSFEFVSMAIGAQGTICGGGRYDGLVETLDGPRTPAVGCGMGLERLVLLLEGRIPEVIEKLPPLFFFVTPDQQGYDAAVPLVQSLRGHVALKGGFRVEFDIQEKPMKYQMSRANKLNALYAVILGGSEVQQGIAILKNMRENKQENVLLKDLTSEILKRAFV